MHNWTANVSEKDRLPTRWIITKASDIRIEVSDPTGGFRVSLRTEDDTTSACTHLWSYMNGASPWDKEENGLVDYWHACSLDDLIDDLQSLDALRKAYIRGEAPVGCPHPYWASWPDGRKRCQACGKKDGPWENANV